MRRLFRQSVDNKQQNEPIEIRVALQGGAVLGAYGAGVLSALSQDPDIKISEASGLSAGAVNISAAAVGGEEALRHVWSRVGDAGRIVHLMSGLDVLNLRETPMFSYLHRSMIAYNKQLNNMGLGTVYGELEHLEDILRDVIPHDEALQDVDMKLHIGTAIKTQAHGPIAANNMEEFIHTNDDHLTVPKIVASGALREFGPVEIDGVKHWDGVYAHKNPPLSMYQDPSDQPLLVISVDPPGVMEADRDPSIVYGLVHEDVSQMRRKDIAQIYHLNLVRKPGEFGHAHDIVPVSYNDTRERARSDQSIRFDARPEVIGSLWQCGEQDALAFMHRLKQDMGYEATAQRKAANSQGRPTLF